MTQITDVLALINKKYAAKHVSAYLGTETPATEYYSSGNILIDAILLGGYGLPKGLLMQLLGDEGSGKSRLCKTMLSSIQRQAPDQYVGIVPAEKMDYTQAGLRIAGIDQARLVVFGCKNADVALQALMDVLWDTTTGLPRTLLSAWAIDSLPALVPNAEQIVELDEEPQQAPHARLFHKTFRILGVKQGDAIGILVNQPRDGRAAGGSGMPVKRPFGGRGPRHWPKLTLELTRYGAEKAGKDFDAQGTAFSVAVRSTKNNIPGVGTPLSQCTYKVYLKPRANGRPMGVDHTECLIRAALQLGLVKKSGGWHEIALDGKTLKKNGEEHFAFALEEANLVAPLTGLVLETARHLNDLQQTPTSELVVDRETGELLMAGEAEGRTADAAGVFALNPEDVTATDDREED